MWNNILSTNTELLEIQSRIERARRTVQNASGTKYETSYQAEGTDFTTYFSAHGLKDPNQLEDDFLNLFIWTWNLKDYLKISFQNMGIDAQEVEKIVSNTKALGYVSDIANRAKHGVLEKSRSNEFAELVNIGIEIPQKSIERITFSGQEISTNIKNPQNLIIQATIRTNVGIDYDAIEILTSAMNTWEIQAISRI